MVFCSRKPERRKIYELLEVETGESKFINCRCITFKESHQGEKSNNLGMKLLETTKEKAQFKMKFLLWILVVAKERL